MFTQKFLLTIGIYLFTISFLFAQGCIEGDCLNGKGVFVDKNNDILVGNFTNGALEGQGVRYFSWGAKYVGSFHEGDIEGQGTYFHSDGTIENGIFQNGVLQTEQPLASPASPPKIKAIVIGLNHTPTTEALRFPLSDAQAIIQFLATSKQSEVTSLLEEDATTENILSTLDKAIAGTNSDEILMVFFFGGHHNEEIYTANGTLAFKDIQVKLNSSQAGQTISFFDVTETTEPLLAMKNSSTREENTSLKNTFTYLLQKDNEFSIEYDGLRYGVFTHYLKLALRGAADSNLDGQVNEEELFSFTFQQLSDYSDGRLFLETFQNKNEAPKSIVPLFSTPTPSE